MTQLRTQRSQLSKAKLERAAFELFAAQGYRQTTLAQIDERSGVSRGSIGHHYGGKEGLLVAVLDRYLPSWVEAVRGLREEGLPAQEALVQGLDVHRRTIEGFPQGPRLFFVALAEALSGDRPELLEPFRRSAAAFRELFEELLEAEVERPSAAARRRAGEVADFVHAAFTGLGFVALVDEIQLASAYAELRRTVEAWTSSLR